MRRRGFLALALMSCLSGCGRHDRRVGPFTGAWGGQGLRDGFFLRPRAIGFSKGEVYVIDTTGRVQVFTHEGAFLRLWNTPSAENGTPTAIHFADEKVLVPDTHYSRILEYSPSGELLNEWGRYGIEPGRFIYPTGIAQDKDGACYVSEYGEHAERVQVFDKSRQLVRTWGGHGEAPGQFNRAMAIALSPEGELFVADTANHRIQRFDKQGKLLAVLGGPEALNFPHDIAVAPDGSILAAEYGAHRISRFRPDGKLVGRYGEPGRGPGQFNAPRGVAVSEDGAVYVADTDNHRVQVFNLGDLR